MPFGGRTSGKIKGLSDARRLPRLGKIRLGVKVPKKGADKRCKHPEGELCIYCSYPKEVDYFVVPKEVAAHFGDSPRQLEVMLPLEDETIVFPQSYEYYGASRGIVCQGNGETALRLNEETGKREERECPCPLFEPDRKCSRRAHLMVIVPKVSMGGVYQLDTGSINSIIDVNSGIEMVRATVGRCSWVPLILRRTKTMTHHKGQKATHYTLQLFVDASAEGVNRLRAQTSRILTGPTARALLEAPALENPELEIGAPVVPEPDNEQQKIKKPEAAAVDAKIAELIGAFDNLGVEVATLEAYIDKKLSLLTADDIKEFKKIWKQVKTKQLDTELRPILDIQTEPPITDELSDPEAPGWNGDEPSPGTVEYPRPDPHAVDFLARCRAKVGHQVFDEAVQREAGSSWPAICNEPDALDTVVRYFRALGAK